MILGDSLAAILRGALTGGSGTGVGWKAAMLPWCQRAPIIFLLSTFVLLPLCISENFASLQGTSVIGLAACAYLAAFVVARLLDGTYLPGGRFFALAPFKPLALSPARGMSEVVNARSLVLLSNLSMAYMNHGMAPGTYQELSLGSGVDVRDAKAVRKAKL